MFLHDSIRVTCDLLSAWDPTAPDMGFSQYWQSSLDDCSQVVPPGLSTVKLTSFPL